MRKNKLVWGVGINDADYIVNIQETIGYVDGKQKLKSVWRCPFYNTWVSMLERCYSEKFHIKQPTYIGCSVFEEWLTFSNFKRWMQTQDWEGKQLDKDLLFKGNKIYSPDTCIFVSKEVNSFLTERGACRGKYPIGVSYKKKSEWMVNELSKPYVAQVSDGTGKTTYLGIFATPEEAHQVWLKAKIELAKELAAEQTDPRVAKAIVERYKNYKESS
jgi:hypothetical protein